ncbi:MAG: hypothetical protein AAGB12_12325 [Pseudomonadota bacterium]
MFLKLSKNVQAVLGITLLIKCLLLIGFSSGYQDDLFIPFINHFIHNGGDPWEAVVVKNIEADFPYPPLMLYLLSLFLWPVSWLSSPFLSSLFYGIPLILSDFAIFYCLKGLYPWRKTEIYIFYFISPIMLFAVFMHGQLDIIPTAMIFASLTLLSQKHYIWSFVLLGCAIATKLHTLAAFPLFAIYLLKEKHVKELGLLFLLGLGLPLIFMWPYLDSQGFQELVLNNPKQRLIFDTYIVFNEIKVYLPVLVTLLIYLRFSAFQKINHDLLFATTGTLFSAFLVLIEASPAWFVWLVPFLTIYYIRYFDGVNQYLLYLALSTTYLLYYLFFYRYEYDALRWFSEPISLTIFPDYELHHLFFTFLEATLVFSVYQFYKNGIASNNIYTMKKAFVIALSGDSGSGKTTLLKGLHKLLGKELLQLEGDGDHKWERGNEKWQYITHLHPKANLLHQQAEKIAELKNRRWIKRSDYLHDTGKFSEESKITAKNFIVIAGLHTLYLPKIRSILDLKIYLDLEETLRVHWKILRDTKQRGHSLEKVLESLEKRREDSKQFIHPQKKFADIVIRFYAVNDYEVGVESEIELGLMVTLDASVHIEELVKYFKEQHIDVDWNYSDDLKNQVLDFKHPPENMPYHALMQRMITNADELTDMPQWDKGYAGILQFLFLMVISELLKERARKYD